MVQTNHVSFLHQYNHWLLRGTRTACENATCTISFFNDINFGHFWAPALRAPGGWQSTRKDLRLLCLFTHSNLTISTQTFICVLSCCDVLVTACFWFRNASLSRGSSTHTRTCSLERVSTQRSAPADCAGYQSLVYITLQGHYMSMDYIHPTRMNVVVDVSPTCHQLSVRWHSTIQFWLLTNACMRYICCNETLEFDYVGSHLRVPSYL
jgi:hypothetical protein